MRYVFLEVSLFLRLNCCPDQKTWKQPGRSCSRGLPKQKMNPFFVIERWTFETLLERRILGDKDNPTPPFNFCRWSALLTGKHENNLVAAGCAGRSCSRGLLKQQKVALVNKKALKKGSDGGAMCTSRVIIPNRPFKKGCFLKKVSLYFFIERFLHTFCQKTDFLLSDHLYWIADNS